MTTTPPRIDPRLGAAALRAPAASREDSRPQAILKLQHRNSIDYRVYYEPQLRAFAVFHYEMTKSFPVSTLYGIRIGHKTLTLIKIVTRGNCLPILIKNGQIL